MKLNKFLLLAPLFMLGSCTSLNEEIKPISLKSSKDEVSLILGSERNLNDIITLIFEPQNISNRNVTWSTEEKEIFTLNGDIIKTHKVGKAKVKATSVMDSSLFVDVSINVYDTSKETYKVNIEENIDYTISSLKESYYEGEEVNFSLNLLNENKIIKEVKANELALTPVNEFKYSFIMPNKDVNLKVVLEDKNKPIPQENSANYSIIYDLGDRKTSKLLDTNETLFNTFNYVGEGESIINSVNDFSYIYGGGYGGGSGDTKWVKGNMLKLGTTSVTGNFTLNLSSYVNKVVIKGYTSAVNAKLRIGDSSSLDFTEETFDNKTMIKECEELAIANKENVEGNVETSMTFEFEKTKSLKVASTNKKPIYITAIEFSYVNE